METNNTKFILLNIKGFIVRVPESDVPSVLAEERENQE